MDPWGSELDLALTCRIRPAPIVVHTRGASSALYGVIPMGTVQLHRVLRAAPEKVYRAFLDADAMAKWLPPNGFTGKVHSMDAKLGGRYKMAFSNFTTGNDNALGGTGLDLN